MSPTAGVLVPDVREWVPADHLAWFVIDAVAAIDLSAFYVVTAVPRLEPGEGGLTTLGG